MSVRTWSASALAGTRKKSPCNCRLPAAIFGGLDGLQGELRIMALGLSMHTEGTWDENELAF
jgi:hypothetical protein